MFCLLQCSCRGNSYNEQLPASQRMAPVVKENETRRQVGGSACAHVLSLVRRKRSSTFHLSLSLSSGSPPPPPPPTRSSFSHNWTLDAAIRLMNGLQWIFHVLLVSNAQPRGSARVPLQCESFDLHQVQVQQGSWKARIIYI